jgi:hypothetical protein
MTTKVLRATALAFAIATTFALQTGAFSKGSDNKLAAKPVKTEAKVAEKAVKSAEKSAITAEKAAKSAEKSAEKSEAKATKAAKTAEKLEVKGYTRKDGTVVKGYTRTKKAK